MKSHFIRNAFFALAIVSCSGGSIADVALSEADTKQKILEYRLSEVYKSSVMDARKAFLMATFAGCSDVTAGPILSTSFLEPMAVDLDGRFSSGAWKESYPFVGCGIKSALNFFFAVNSQHKIDSTVGLPGATRAPNVLWQYTFNHDVVGQLKAFTKSDCANFVILNTAVGTVKDRKIIEGSDIDFPPGQTWPEVWTVDACGIKYLVPFQNRLNGSGVDSNFQPKTFVQL